MMLKCRVGSCLAIMCLLLIEGPVHAEWVALEDHHQSHPLQTVYIDPDTVRREGHLIVLSALIDWKSMQGGRTPTRFYSTKLTKQFDCGEKRVRTLSSTDFYGHMGTGEMIGGGNHPNDGHWVAIDPGTINEELWEAICRKD